MSFIVLFICCACFFFLRSVLCVLKSSFAVVFADVTGIGIMDILGRQSHFEVYA